MYVLVLENFRLSIPSAHQFFSVWLVGLFFFSFFFLFGCFAFKKVESCYVLYQTAALVQKNSEATQALAAQGDILEKELGEIQKVLLSMQVDICSCLLIELINSDRMIMLNSVKLEYYYIPLSSLPCSNMQKYHFSLLEQKEIFSNHC